MDIKKDLLNYYMHELTDEELENFDSLTDEAIRLIANRIWENFLNKDFELGKSFKFLAMFACPIELIKDNNSYDQKEGYVKLISNNDLNFYCDEVDFIVDIDWTKTNKVYLPIHFKKGSYFITGGINYKAVLAVNNGEGVISSAVDYAMSKPYGLPFYNLDLTYYDETRKPDNNKIVLDVICHYIINEHHKMDFDLRKTLMKKYRKFIITSFTSMREYCTSEEMLEFMENHIRIHEKTPVDKEFKIW